ncbi:MAG: hypothetical protein HYV63_15770 [Candidatus Schekmanbacteria bacterium]|nr:hypothetical protein [Candidatus Schekmanbacteria bacterium]
MTLIELLIAITLLVVITAGVSQMFLHSSVQVSDSRTRANALALATGRMEELRSLSYDNLVAMPTYTIQEARELATGGFSLTVLCDSTSGCETPAYTGYKMVTHVRSGVPTATMAEIRVQVLWKRTGAVESTNTGALYNPADELYDFSGVRPVMELRTFVMHIPSAEDL